MTELNILDLEDIILSEISHRKKSKYCVICYMWNLFFFFFKHTENRLVVARGRG